LERPLERLRDARVRSALLLVSRVLAAVVTGAFGAGVAWMLWWRAARGGSFVGADLPRRGICTISLGLTGLRTIVDAIGTVILR